jgi:hypothetical protein
MEELDHRLDHYPTESSLLFSSHISLYAPKLFWRMADKVVLSLKAIELDLFYRSFRTYKNIDSGVDRLVRWIN